MGVVGRVNDACDGAAETQEGSAACRRIVRDVGLSRPCSADAPLRHFALSRSGCVSSSEAADTEEVVCRICCDVEHFEHAPDKILVYPCRCTAPAHVECIQLWIKCRPQSSSFQDHLLGWLAPAMTVLLCCLRSSTALASRLTFSEQRCEVCCAVYNLSGCSMGADNIVAASDVAEVSRLFAPGDSSERIAPGSPYSLGASQRYGRCARIAFFATSALLLVSHAVVFVALVSLRSPIDSDLESAPKNIRSAWRRRIDADLFSSRQSVATVRFHGISPHLKQADQSALTWPHLSARTAAPEVDFVRPFVGLQLLVDAVLIMIGVVLGTARSTFRWLSLDRAERLPSQNFELPAPTIRASQTPSSAAHGQGMDLRLARYRACLAAALILILLTQCALLGFLVSNLLRIAACVHAST